MKHRVLVVEDNAANSELLRDWLEAEGFETACAENLEQSFAAFKKQPPDVVLLDVQLGAEDGLSLAAWIRKEPAVLGTPVIAVTAHALVTDQERVIRAGCDACISKPVDFKVLSAELKSWLGHAAKAQSDKMAGARILTPHR
jgi:DNA-binding response OmpR family regulator